MGVRGKVAQAYRLQSGLRGARDPGCGGEVIGFFRWILLGTNIPAHRCGGVPMRRCADAGSAGIGQIFLEMIEI